MLANFANKSIREAQKIAISLSSVQRVVKPDQIKVIAENRLEFQFEGSIELQEKFEALKAYLAHSNPNISLGELFEKLCDLGLEKWNPAKPLRKNSGQKSESEATAAARAALPTEEAAETATSRLKGDAAATSRAKTELPATSRAQIRRHVFARAQHRCENCKSKYALEIDHIKPQAFGGDSTIENLRVLCRSCNQRAAIRNLGLQKMNAFLNSRIL